MFKVGDAVRLKGDGPTMTVLEAQDAHVVCAWCNAEGRLETFNFPNDAVRALVGD